jgi:hypothetical protein
MSRPSNWPEIPTGLEQPPNVLVFERRTRTATPQYGRYDSTNRLRALEDENAVLRRQAAVLARHNAILRMRKMLEEVGSQNITAISFRTKRL